MEAVTLLPLKSVQIIIGLFTNVENATFLREQLLSQNTDYEYAFLDASILLSRQQILAACFRAINDRKHHRLKSRNVHSEIVFSFSPNNNIAESFRRFGISDTTTHVVAIKVGSDCDQIEEHLTANIKGTLVPCSDDNLRKLQDTARIRKIYRLEGPKKGEVKPLGWQDEAFVLGSMALKGS